MIHSGKARNNRDQQRQSLVNQIKQQALRTADYNYNHDPVADARHIEFMNRKNAQ